MSAEFAEKILDGMVDGDGWCGERGLSERQFDILAEHLEARNEEVLGGWSGSRGGHIRFTSTDYMGDIGKYRVHLNEFWHFNRRCTVVDVRLRPAEELEELERRRELEERLREIGKFEHSEWQFLEKERVDLELTLVRKGEFERERFDGRGFETVRVYTMADDGGNCYVWKTTSWLDWDMPSHTGSDEYVQAEPGDRVSLRATVKRHGTYRGIDQTELSRCKVNGIERAA